MDFTEKMQRHQKMGLRDYIEALEVERRKIQVFPRELPLSLELITQAIEACRKELSGTSSEYNLTGLSECSEQTSMEGPVLEQFIPIRKRASPDCDEDDEDEEYSHKPKIIKDMNTDKRKSDWLRSAQLWNPQPTVKEDFPRKVSVELKRNNGGAFQPFHRDASINKTDAMASKAPSSTPVAAATSSTAGAVSENNKKVEKEERKQRRCWSQELHERFLHALQQLGGADSATPKQIRELMRVEGLTNDEVKSHLQKFRLHTRRPSSMIHNNGNSQTAPFVIVGNILVQPPEYAASGQVTTVAAPTGIYAPVAAPPRAVPAKPQFRELQHYGHYNLEEGVNHSDVNVHSNSPTSSSSTHTTTASPGYSI